MKKAFRKIIEYIFRYLWWLTRHNREEAPWDLSVIGTRGRWLIYHREHLVYNDFVLIGSLMLCLSKDTLEIQRKGHWPTVIHLKSLNTTE